MTQTIKSETAVSYAEAQVGDPQRWLALPVLLTGAFLPILDFNVVNLALPAIRQNLGTTSSEVQFVISAYAATYAVFLITGGRLGTCSAGGACFCSASPGSRSRRCCAASPRPRPFSSRRESSRG